MSRTTVVLLCLIAASVQAQVGSDRDSAWVRIKAEGEVRNALSEQDGSSPSSGALGIFYETKTWRLIASVNVAATENSVEGSDEKVFGSALLIPGASNSSASIEWTRDLCKRGWLHLDYSLTASISATSSTWIRSISPDSAITSDVVVWAGALKGICKPVTGTNRDNDITVSIEAGLIWRYLSGDINEGRSNRERFLGVNSRFWIGFEPGLVLEFNSLKAYALFPSFHLGGGVRGLSQGRLIVGIILNADLFKFRMSKSEGE